MIFQERVLILSQEGGVGMLFNKMNSLNRATSLSRSFPPFFACQNQSLFKERRREESFPKSTQSTMLRTAARSLVRTTFCRTAAVAPLKRMPVARMLAIKVPQLSPPRMFKIVALQADSSSHSDFGAVSHQDVPASITERIEQDLSADDVVLYMKVPTSLQILL